MIHFPGGCRHAKNLTRKNVHRDDSQVFTTRQSLEFIFRSARPEDNELVDVMVVGTADGLIHLSLYDSFVVGGLGKRDSGSQLAGHSYHPESSTHALLFKPAASPLDALFLVPMDLCFIRSSPVNLSLLTSKMTTWQKLLRYISQVQLHMVQEWKSTRDLPNRFLRGIQEDLKEAKTGPKDIVQALYHLVVTGHTYPQVKEWLVDGLAERGHKRWDKAVVAGLQSVRSLAHENLIPALERTAVILSRLLGLARFHDGLDDGLGFTAAQISRMLDIVGALLLVANRVLMTVMDELDHFVVFSAWLRHEIDRQASSSSSGGAPASGIDELAEMDATLQHGKVLTYVRTYLVRSPLVLFLGDDHVARDDYQTDWQHVEGGESLVEMLDRQLAKEETGQPHMKALPRLEFLVSYLSSRSQKIFESIELNLKRGVRFEKPTRLSIGGRIRKYATRLCPGIQTVSHGPNVGIVLTG